MAIQVLRFVSPHPWGSHTAEGFRRSAGLDRIVTSLFGNVPGGAPKKAAFSAGSHVLWTPVYIRPDGQLKHAKPVSKTENWTEGWLASRSPPYRSANGPSVLEVDITPLILDKKSSADTIEVLYDNRFALSFDLRTIPDEVFERLRTPSVGHQLVVAATGKYFLPRLILRAPNGTAVEDIGMSGPSPYVSATAVSGIYGCSVGAGWANWRLARVFE